MQEGLRTDICTSKVQQQNKSYQLVHDKVWIVIKRAKLRVCVCVFIF